MRNQFANYSMDNINDDLNDLLKDKVVNSFRLFAMKDSDRKLSVTMLPMSEYSDRYHGLHPKFDESYLKRVLGSTNINTSKAFWKHVFKLQSSNNDQLFDLLLDKDQLSIIETSLFKVKNLSELKSILLGRAILQMVSHYGFVIGFNDSAVRDEFFSDFDQICKSLNTDMKLHIHNKKDDQDNQVILSGIIPIDIICRLQAKYDLVENNNKLELILCGANTECNLLVNTLTFQDMRHFQFISGGVYYSGVMPRVNAVELKRNQTSNSNVKYFSFKVCRTTFATVDMMDNSEVLNHYFFTNGDTNVEKRSAMFAFDEHEDQVQSMFLHEKVKIQDKITQEEYEIRELSRINEYLKYSMNTHTVAVSCNIKTSDNYLIAAQRDARSIDAGEFYCSANGQSEFMDVNVNFYRESVFEDLPSMDYYSDYRVDLNNELRREAVAELGITSLNSEWEYLGVSYLAIDNTSKLSGSNNAVKRRMHFNVLSFNRTSLDFKSVVVNQKVATENFENSKVIGIQTVLVSGLVDLISKTMKALYNWTNRNKSRVLLILFFISFIISKDNKNELSINNVIDITLLLLYFIFTAYDYLRAVKYRRLKFIKRIYMPFYFRNDSIKMKNILYRLSRKGFGSKYITFHGIFIIMYILTLIHEE